MLDRAASALGRFEVQGLDTTIPFHADLLKRAAFQDGTAHTRWVEQEMLS
ncbi:MAG: hypothetical protein HC850_00610 [Rhodomicrobium sp.]|nr:hypothetical protein [Rhodomicrobium sp.]